MDSAEALDGGDAGQLKKVPRCQVRAGNRVLLHCCACHSWRKRGDSFSHAAVRECSGRAVQNNYIHLLQQKLDVPAASAMPLVDNSSSRSNLST
jgi:hypothetical protein